MKHLGKLAVAALTLSLMASGVSAQSVGKPDEKVRWRQSAYSTMGWSMQRIKANVDGKYDADQVRQAANVIQAIANSGMGALFTADTQNVSASKAKPNLFTDGEGVGKVARAFIEEANQLAKTAASSDAAAVKAQFGKLAEACKACHKDYRQKD